MALTRPRLGQLNTSVVAQSDPITVLNQGASSANVDVGFLFNRANGLVSNVALYWSESAQSIVTAYTNSSGVTNANISTTSYANLTVGNVLLVTGSILNVQGNIAGNTSGIHYGNVSATGNISTSGDVYASNFFYANGTPFTSNITAGNIFVNSNTQSVNTTTGALIVAGGVGIAGNLNVGANVTVTGNALPSANVTYSLGSSTQRWKDLWLSGTTLYLGGATISSPTGVVTITNDAGGSFSVTGSAPGQASGTFGNLTANSNIVSTSTTTGALIVQGGAGIAGAVYAGSIYDNGTRVVSTSTGAGNLTISAGAITLPATGPGAVNVGSATSIPTIVTDAYGRVVGLTSNAISTSFTLAGTTGTTTVSGGSTLSFASTNGVTVGVGATYANISTPQDIRTTATPAFAGATINGTLVATTVNAATIGNSGATLTGTLSTASQPNITTLAGLTSFGTAGATTTALGNLAIGGNLTVTGNSVSIGASTLSITDPIINLNTPSDLTPLTVATTNDIGLKFHYYDTADSAAFLGRTTSDGYLTWWAKGTDSANVFTGTALGTIKTGAMFLANTGTALTVSDTVVAKTVNAGTIGNTGATLTGTLSTAAQPNITSVGTLTGLTTGGNTVVNSTLYAQGVYDNGIRAVSTSSGAGNLTISAGAITLPATGPGAVNVGSATSIPTIVTDAYGRVVGLTSNAISTSFTLAGTTGTTTISGGSTLSFASTNGVTVSVGATYANVSTPQDVRTTASPTFAGATLTGTVIAATVNAATIGNIGANVVGTGTYLTSLTATNVSGTVATANVALYDTVTAYTTNQTFYPQFANVTSGNTSAGVATSLAFNPGTGSGTLNVGTLVTATVNAATIGNSGATLTGTIQTAAQTNITSVGTLSGLTTSGNTIVNSTLYAQGVYDNGTRVVSTSSGAGNLTISGTAITLPTTGPGAVTTGNSTAIPIITTDAYGRIASISTSVISSSGFSLAGTSGTGSVSGGGTLTFASTNGITATASGSTVTISSPQDLQTTASPTFANLTVANIIINTGGKRNNRNIVTNYTGNTAPSAPVMGDEWFRANTGVLYKYTFDNITNTNNWIDISSALYNANTAAVANTIALRDSGGNLTATNFLGTASSAKYADLAEMYTADDAYGPATVVVFGGTAEVTVTTESHDSRVAGVISTNPAYLMNSELAGGLPVAFTGRVPCQVRGPVSKGDLLVTSTTAGVAQRLDKQLFQPGCVIGKSLDTIQNNDIVTIEVAVGRY